MAETVEVLMIGGSARSSLPMLHGIAKAVSRSRDSLVCTEEYRGHADWLVIYGVGSPDRHAARQAHIARGGRVLMFDIGYVGDRYNHLRCSINHDHPQDWLDRTPPDPHRWARHNIALRDDYDPRGPIILVGLGHKTKAYLGCDTWEADKLAELRQRFPGRRIVFRPKRKSEIHLDCEKNEASRIEQVLRGASLVVCRHSNVAVDAIIAGVPFEAEDGAASWLLKREFTVKNRSNFLQRLCWWQWKAEEAFQAWQFIKRVSACG